MDHKHPAHPPLADDVPSAERGKTSLPSFLSVFHRENQNLSHSLSLSEFLFCQFASWTSGLIKGFIIGASSRAGISFYAAITEPRPLEPIGYKLRDIGCCYLYCGHHLTLLLKFPLLGALGKQFTLVAV